MINCKQEGHTTNPVKYLCIYQQCNKQRFSCDMCLWQNIHNHHEDKLKYFVSLNCFEEVISAYYMKINIKITDEILENIIKNQIIIIDEAIDDCTLNNKQSLHRTESQGVNIAFSNNRKLMVTWAQDEQLKMWRNCKLINKMEFIQFKVGIFSEDDLYFYIGHENMIVKFDVQQNFKLVDWVELGLIMGSIDGFEPFQFINNLKVITSNIVLGSIDQYIFRVDLQLKKPTLKLNLYHMIRSLDYQKKRQVILSYTDDICIWDSTGNLILKNKGSVLSKITDLRHSSYILIIANFIGDEDRIITVNPSGIIIWFIDYNQRILILNKIIQSPSMICITQLNIEKNQINLIRQNDYISLSLTDFKYKVKKHKAQIKQSLKKMLIITRKFLFKTIIKIQNQTNQQLSEVHLINYDIIQCLNLFNLYIFYESVFDCYRVISFLVDVLQNCQNNLVEMSFRSQQQIIFQYSEINT